MVKVKKKKKLNFKRTLVLLLFLYIMGYSVYYLVNRPIKHIEIVGNDMIKDSEILKVSKLKDYPSIFRYTSNSIEKRISDIDLVHTVKVKKKLGNIIRIEITEKKLLFYYETINKIVLSDGNIVDNTYNKIYGIPILTNSVKRDLLDKFIKNFSKINNNIIYEMNEIEYFPKYDDNNKLVSNDRFKIIMNDGNTVIVNVNTVHTLNKYNTIYASLGDRKGTINLDSNKLENLVFIPYEE